MLSIRRLITPLLLPLLALALLAAPAQAAKPWVKLDWGGIVSGSKTTVYVGIKHSGGPIRNMKVCWESTAWCVSGSGRGNGGWSATFSSPTKMNAWRKVVLYYQIDGYNYKHIIRDQAYDPNNGGRGGAPLL